MNSSTTQLHRRTYLATTAAATLGMVGLAGCSGGSTGTLATQVTDQPADIEDFESCVLSIVGMWLGPEGAASGTADGEEPSDRTYHEYDESQEADLVDLQGEQTQLIDERNLDTGTYEFLQLDVDDISATLTDGSDASVEMPGEAPLTFNQPFDIRADTTTTFTADCAPVKRGQASGYVLQPVPQGINVDYEENQ